MQERVDMDGWMDNLPHRPRSHHRLSHGCYPPRAAPNRIHQPFWCRLMFTVFSWVYFSSLYSLPLRVIPAGVIYGFFFFDNFTVLIQQFRFTCL